MRIISKSDTIDTLETNIGLYERIATMWLFLECGAFHLCALTLLTPIQPSLPVRYFPNLAMAARKFG